MNRKNWYVKLKKQKKKENRNNHIMDMKKIIILWIGKIDILN
jgi:hypothetical protein